MDIRTGPRRRAAQPNQGPQALLMRYGSRGLKLLGLQSEDDLDTVAAERSDRLSAFYRGDPVPDLFRLDIEPLLQESHDAAYHALLELDPAAPGAIERDWMLKGGIVALNKFAQSINTSIDLGAGARERMAQRHLRLAAAADVAREGVSKSG